MTKIIAAITVAIATVILVVLLSLQWLRGEDLGGDFYWLTLSYSTESGKVSLVDVEAVKAELPPLGVKSDQSNQWSFQAVAYSLTGEKIEETWANVRKAPGATAIPFKVLMPALKEGPVVVRDGDGKRLGDFKYEDLTKKAYAPGHGSVQIGHRAA